MSSNICKTCRGPKANYHCGICEESICKSCAQFMGDDAFAFELKIPAEFKHTTYCTNCFDDRLAAPLAVYNETVEKAREVMVFSKDQNKQVRLVKREHAPVIVTDCEDEEETIMRLAYQAAQLGFNAIVDTTIKNSKIIVGSHKKTVFSASAHPVTIDPNAVKDY